MIIIMRTSINEIIDNTQIEEEEEKKKKKKKKKKNKIIKKIKWEAKK